MSVHVATPPITVGVGAVMVHGDRLLVVKRTYSAVRGLWTIPSGYVEPRESVAMTLAREVREETGVLGRPGRLVAVRNRVTADVNDTFLVFHMDYESGEPHPDGTEVSAAAFVPLSELASSQESAPFTKAVIEKVLHADGMQLDSYAPPGPRREGEFYLLYR